MKRHSLFWPLTLIAVGVLWLLVSIDIVPAENLWALTHYWPILLIALGFGLILRARWPAAGTAITVLVVLGAVGVVLIAPLLGWNNVPNWNLGIRVPSGIGGSVKGSGILKTETRSVSGFDAIRIDYPAYVTIHQGDIESLTIEADDNLLPQLEARISGTKMIIDNNEPDWQNRVNPTQVVKIDITVKNFQRVEFSTAGKLVVEGLTTTSLDVSLGGAGDIVLKNLSLEKMNCTLSGAGNFTASGSANTLAVIISGMGDFNGKDLVSDSAEVRISGAGSATVWVSTSLEASISGAGSVSYYGTPTSVEKNISGVGSVKSLGNK